MPRRIRYDNLRAAVDRILQGRDRVENQRFIALHSHMGSTRSSASPVSVTRMRRVGWRARSAGSAVRHLVPIRVVATITELNEHLAQTDHADHADNDRHIGNRRTTVGADFAAERPHLRTDAATRNRKVGESVLLDCVIVIAIEQRGPFRSQLLPVCCPGSGSKRTPARGRRPARSVTRAFVGVEVRGFEPLASSVRASWG